jgi:hypothetical protein
MSEIEVPLEKVQEDIQDSVAHGEATRWMNLAALLSAFLAVAAAVSALFAGHYANDAMLEQIQASNQWAYYQAKGIKLSLAEFRSQNGESEKLKEKIEKYHQDQDNIKDQAMHFEDESRGHLQRHENLAASVTLFQVAIALTAIAVLTRKRRFLLTSMALGAAGLLWTVWTFI